MLKLVQAVFGWIHNRIAPGPKIVVRWYIELVSAICRHLPRKWTAHMQISVSGGRVRPWSQKEFPARVVEVGVATKILLAPHLGEFDESALFARRMDYEQEVFAWLEQNAPKAYDIVIEIGANVGIYTCFFDALIKATPDARLTGVVAFEPSQEAYRRLMVNLAANDARAVKSFNAAVAAKAGFHAFYEPSNHLTNGSFHKDFSQIFSNQVVESTVLAVAPSDLGHFLKGKRHPLIKIDVEGYEATLLQGMAEIIDAHHPDLLLEVLKGLPEELEAMAALQPYRKFLITKDGLRPHPRLFASETMRDWLLVHPDSLTSID
jgi:FkbM family methyltransferase